MSINRRKRRPNQAGVYWFIPADGEPMIVELFKDGAAWALFKLGTDEIFYLTRPKQWSVAQWKEHGKFVGEWVGPLEPPV